MIIKEFGIMQGRLLPKYMGRFQAHPLGYWKEEFRIAKKFGLNYIEFILDFNEYEQNPLMSDSGISEILEIIQETGIGVRSICADYFMEAPFHSNDLNVIEESKKVLIKLIINASKIGVTDIVIPCVDQSALRTESNKINFIKELAEPLEFAEKYNIHLALETDLSPKYFLELLNQFNSNYITVNYDLGNSASLGYNIIEEFQLYGNKITDIHIKDRILGGGSVELGLGNANFRLFNEEISKLKFKGPIIMQVYRDEEGVEIFAKQFEWFKNKLQK